MNFLFKSIFYQKNVYSYLTCFVLKMKMGALEKNSFEFEHFWHVEYLSSLTVLYSRHLERSRTDISQLMWLYKEDDFTFSCMINTHETCMAFRKYSVLNRSSVPPLQYIK